MTTTQPALMASQGMRFTTDGAIAVLVTERGYAWSVAALVVSAMLSGGLALTPAALDSIDR